MPDDVGQKEVAAVNSMTTSRYVANRDAHVRCEKKRRVVRGCLLNREIVNEETRRGAAVADRWKSLECRSPLRFFHRLVYKQDDGVFSNREF